MDFNSTKETIMSIKTVDNTNKQFVSDVAKYIGFTLPSRDCKCKDQYNDLLIKLQLFFRKRDAWCKYRMKLGIVRWTPMGNAYNLILTDEQAEWILENDEEGSKFITRIVPDIAETSLENAKEDSNIIILEKENNVPESAELAQTAPKKSTRKRKNNDA